MQDNISIFKHENFGDTRIIQEGDAFFAVAKDVVEKVGNTWRGHDSIRHVPAQWQGARSVRTPEGVKEISARIHELFNQEVFA